MNTQKVNPFWQIIDELNDSILANTSAINDVNLLNYNHITNYNVYFVSTSQTDKFVTLQLVHN